VTAPLGFGFVTYNLTDYTRSCHFQFSRSLGGNSKCITDFAILVILIKALQYFLGRVFTYQLHGKTFSILLALMNIQIGNYTPRVDLQRKRSTTQCKKRLRNRMVPEFSWLEAGFEPTTFGL